MTKLKEIRDFNDIKLKDILKGLIIYLVLGMIIGFLSKILDETAANSNWILEILDLGNFFSRMGVWVFLCSLISIKSKHPLLSAINVFTFLGSMLFAYYMITLYVYGFYPRTYIMIWVAITLVSPLLAFICFFAKGKHWISRVLSTIIILMIARETFAVGFWYFDLTYPLELILLIIMMKVLYTDKKQMLLICGIDFVLLFILSQFQFINGIL